MRLTAMPDLEHTESGHPPAGHIPCRWGALSVVATRTCFSSLLTGLRLIE